MAKQVDPGTLLFSTSAQPRSEKAEWKEPVEHLAKVMGKKVEHVARLHGIAGGDEPEGRHDPRPGPHHGAGATAVNAPGSCRAASWLPTMHARLRDGDHRSHG
jgi:hypothetical protein